MDTADSSRETPNVQRAIRPWFRIPARLGYLLYVCRVPILACLFVFVLGWKVEQIHEVVRVHLVDLDEPESWRTALLNLASIYVLLFLLSWSVMFWTEYCIASRFPRVFARNRILRWASIGLPAALASFLWAGGALALQGADAGLPPAPHLIANLLFWAMLIFFGPGAIGWFYSPKARQAFQRASAWGTKPAGIAFGLSDQMILSTMVAFSLFLFATIDPYRMGQWFGTIGIMLSAALAILPSLTWLTSSPLVPRWHWLSILLGIAGVWSWFDVNDNHYLRLLDNPNTSVNAPDFGSAFREWLVARAPEGDEPYPVVLVAAEGGGIRAGYFTAQVLAAIQDQCPAFANHLFAVSGVSGGSVGTAVFAGILDAAHLPEPKATQPCEMTKLMKQPIADKVESILRTDYLAPVVATMLYPDALQRLLPSPIAAWDRARTLEQSVEKSFKDVVATDFLERSIYSYWKSTRSVPLLLLNTTHVATGARVVIAPVQFLNERFHQLKTLFDHNPSADVRISTAAVTSARFPGVTPAGSLQNSDGKYRYVDGGYFENSGTLVVAEALATILQEAALIKRNIKPVVIRIGNSPSPLAATALHPAQSQQEGPTSMSFGELLSPLRTMINTRDARGELAAENLKTAVTSLLDDHKEAYYIEFQIGLGDIPIPLGWQLSQTSRKELRAQLAQVRPCGSYFGIDNGCAVGAVVEALRTRQ